ncbi:MAG: MATE family efflux transporter [Acidaminococcus sp.]|jgi:putative MATE family efflux protein|nr:MATE family efflux transporter [Acidaminococcus sp.]
MMRKLDYGSGSVGKNILYSAIPLTIAQLLLIFYNIVDRFYIGRIPGSGTLALGAVGICFPVIVLVTAFTNLFGIGGAPLFSIALGQKNPKKAQEIVNTAYRLECISALLILLIGEAAMVPLLHLFGAGKEAMPYAVPYLRIYLLGTFCVMISGGMNPYMTAQGYPRAGMIAILIGAIANLILDPIFIFAFGMGVSGAAWATVISQTLSWFYVRRFFASSLSSFKLWLRKKDSEKYLPHALDIMGLGVVPFIMQATNSLVQVVANHALMQWGGALFISAMTIISSVRQVIETPVATIAQGAAPLVSYNYGAHDAAKVRRGIQITTIVAVGYALTVWILIASFPHFFARIFTSDEALIEETVHAIHLYFFAFIFQAFQVTGQNIFRALNKRKQAIFFSLFRKVILVVPLTLLLPNFMGLGTDGVFIAEPISNLIGGTFSYSTMVWIVSHELKSWKEKTDSSQMADGR